MTQENKHNPLETYLEELGRLRREGIPIFSKDPNKVVADIIKSMYYAVRAHIPNAGIVFLNDIHPNGEVFWLVEADDYGIGDSIRHAARTHYIPPKESNHYTSSIKTIHADFLVGRLNPQEVRSSWDFMRNVIPEEEFTGYPPMFDIVKWYEMMSM